MPALGLRSQSRAGFPASSHRTPIPPCPPEAATSVSPTFTHSTVPDRLLPCSGGDGSRPAPPFFALPRKTQQPALKGQGPGRHHLDQVLLSQAVLVPPSPAVVLMSKDTGLSNTSSARSHILCRHREAFPKLPGLPFSSRFPPTHPSFHALPAAHTPLCPGTPCAYRQCSPLQPSQQRLPHPLLVCGLVTVITTLYFIF